MKKYLKFSLAVVLAGAFAGCAEVTEALNSINKVASGASLATEINPSTICNEWKENEARAIQNYNNKMIKFKGELTHISSSALLSNTASFKSGNADLTYVPENSKADNIATLSKGKSYIVTGKITSISYSLDPKSKCDIGLLGALIE
ncbi:hypothetical protein LMG7974_00999 [Campylobacter majalis]|uniref:Lipoprotein n=1 Tax=Campylobacter majalis TaxID=2790656 RepID=A0ABN7K7R2_9BACT|nr:hypothetical protein [Campylobacter majalis]CAD7288417.1 hypothetical protein LMG7974_00999 [Campylobacter majalis]